MNGGGIVRRIPHEPIDSESNGAKISETDSEEDGPCHSEIR